MEVVEKLGAGEGFEPSTFGIGACRTGSYDERWFQSLVVQASADRRGEMASWDWKRNDNPSHHIVELVVPLCAQIMVVMARDTGHGDGNIALKKCLSPSVMIPV